MSSCCGGNGMHVIPMNAQALTNTFVAGHRIYSTGDLLVVKLVSCTTAAGTPDQQVPAFAHCHADPSRHCAMHVGH